MKHIHGGDVYRYENYLDFSANCSPLGLPEEVKAAIVEAVPSIIHYPDVQCEKLKKAISLYEQVPSEQVVCGNGAAEVIFALCLARKPRKALVLSPTFAEYEQALESVDCKVSYAALSEETGFQIQGEALLNQIREESPDIMFLCNPNNPTGVLTKRSLLEEILEVCRQELTLLVVDECFLDFVEEPDRFTMKEFLSKTEDLFLVKAFTKRYAMAGIRLGYGLTGNRSLLEKMETVTQPWNVSGIAQAAGIAALDARDYVAESRNLIFQEKHYLKEELSKLSFRLYESSANYLFFQGPQGLTERMKTHEILIRDCGNYHGLKDGFYRVAVRTHEENKQLIQAFHQELD